MWDDLVEAWKFMGVLVLGIILPLLAIVFVIVFILASFAEGWC